MQTTTGYVSAAESALTYALYYCDAMTMPNKKYSFQFNTTRCEARVSRDALHLKYGHQKKKIAINNLQYLYLNYDEKKSIMTLLLRHKISKGLDKIEEIKSNSNQNEFTSLIENLVNIKPDIDIRNMNQAEARALFVIKLPDKPTPKHPIKLLDADVPILSKAIVFTLYIVVVVTIIVFPSANHLLDTKQQTLSAQAFIDGTKTTTRNITLTGAILLKDYMSDIVTVSTGYRGTDKVYINYFALVTKKYNTGDPVQLILKIEGDNTHEISRLLQQTEFTGVIQDIWWEGVPDSTIDFFENKVGYPISKDVKLLDSNISKGSDWLLLIILVGLSSILLFFTFIPSLQKKRRSSNHS